MAVLEEVVEEEDVETGGGQREGLGGGGSTGITITMVEEGVEGGEEDFGGEEGMMRAPLLLTSPPRAPSGIGFMMGGAGKVVWVRAWGCSPAYVPHALDSTPKEARSKGREALRGENDEEEGDGALTSPPPCVAREREEV